jgi:hypothetical protein
MRHRFAIALAVCASVSSVGAAAPDAAPGPGLNRHVARDPLAVAAFTLDDPQRSLTGFLDVLQRFAGGTDESAEVPKASGAPDVWAQVAATVGPELVAVVDLPPIDGLAAQVMASGESLVGTLLARSGVIAAARDAQVAETALVRALEALGGRVVPGDGVRQVRFAGSGEGADLDVFVCSRSSTRKRRVWPT